MGGCISVQDALSLTRSVLATECQEVEKGRSGVDLDVL